MKESWLSIWNLETGDAEGGAGPLHLRLSKGDFVELLGTEGSGKTELCRFFAGRERIRSGYVEIAGRRYEAGETIGEAPLLYLGAESSIAGSLSVAENLLLLSKKRRIRGILRHRDLEARCSFLLSQFGLSIRAGQRGDTLTEGEKRAVELLRAVEHDIPFIFIDNRVETLGKSDLQLVEECLAELKRRGFTILLISGGFPVFSGLDDRVLVLRKGRNVRTYYRGNFDRESYVKWVFGVADPVQLREGAVTSLEQRTERLGGRGEVFRVREVSAGSLRDFSLSVKEGEIIGLYDMNNRNNRLLIRVILGEQELDAGTMRLKGALYAPGGLEEAMRLGVGYLPGTILQNAVVGDMSYGENLTLSTMLRDRRLGFLKNERMTRYLVSEYGAEFAEEGEKRHGKPAMERVKGYELNPYGRMRVALQRMLIRRPALLLMEDIMSDMNVRMLTLQNQYLARISSEGTGILISSQNLAVLRQVCDRILVMNSWSPIAFEP